MFRNHKLHPLLGAGGLLLLSTFSVLFLHHLYAGAMQKGECHQQLGGESTDGLPDGTADNYRIISNKNIGYMAIRGCGYYIIENNKIKQLKIENSHHIIIRNNEIGNAQYEGVSVRRGSRDIQILHNTIQHTGGICSENPSHCQYGEGIYLGDGQASGALLKLLKSQGNRQPTDSEMQQVGVKRVLIKGNRIHHVREEAIEAKLFVEDVVIEDNHISHGVNAYSGAITVGDHMQHHLRNTNHIIRNNYIHDSTAAKDPATGKIYGSSASGILVNIGSTISNNLIERVHGCGIHFRNPIKHPIKVNHNYVVEAGRNNEITNPGIVCGSGLDSVRLGADSVNASDVAVTLRKRLQQRVGHDSIKNANYGYDAARASAQALPFSNP